MKKITILLCLQCAIVIASYSISHAADTFDKAKLSRDVELEIRAVLQNESEHPVKTNVKQQFPSLVEARIALLSQAISNSTMTKLDEESARWLKNSFVDYAKGIHLKGFAEHNQGRDKEFQAIANTINVRLKNANSERIQVWTEQSRLMAAKATKYRQDFKELLILKLSSTKSYKINLGTGVSGFYVGAFSMSSVVGALGYRIESTVEDNLSSSNSIDLRTNVIDSQILCLSLIRFIDAKFSQDAIFDRFSYENILSAAFEEGDPYGARKEKSFDEVLVTAKKILDEAIQPGEVTTINWRLFVRSLQDITELRVQNNLKNSESKQSDQQNAYVIFVNKKELWD